MLVILKLLGKPYTVTGSYIPPPFTKQFFDCVLISILGIAEGSLLIAGDYNTDLDNSLDRFRCSTLPPTPLGSHLTQFDLVEAWRWQHVDGRKYSCQTDSYGTLSRIDLCLLYSDMCDMVSDVKYLPRAVFDHSPLLVDLALGVLPSFRVWRQSLLWLVDQAIANQD